MIQIERADWLEYRIIYIIHNLTVPLHSQNWSHRASTTYSPYRLFSLRKKNKYTEYTKYIVHKVSQFCLCKGVKAKTNLPSKRQGTWRTRWLKLALGAIRLFIIRISTSGFTTE